MTAAVDEECRRAVDSAAHTAHEMLAYQARIGSRCQLTGEADDVEIEHLCVAHQVVVGQSVLVLVEHVVHRPERALRRGNFRGLSGGLSVRVDLRQREVTEGEPQLMAEAALDSLDDRVSLSTERTLIVPILDERHWRGGRTLNMVNRADRWS